MSNPNPYDAVIAAEEAALEREEAAVSARKERIEYLKRFRSQVPQAVSLQKSPDKKTFKQVLIMSSPPPITLKTAILAMVSKIPQSSEEIFDSINAAGVEIKINSLRVTLWKLRTRHGMLEFINDDPTKIVITHKGLLAQKVALETMRVNGKK